MIKLSFMHNDLNLKYFDPKVKFMNYTKESIGKYESSQVKIEATRVLISLTLTRSKTIL